jgi:hypothetical protein
MKNKHIPGGPLRKDKTPHRVMHSISMSISINIYTMPTEPVGIFNHIHF